ncbi:hypothetical protein JCM3770_005645 [Rhodotorula araucariae]
MADQEWQQPAAGNGDAQRSPSPRRDRARSRSRSPMRVDQDRRDDRGRSDTRGGDQHPGNNPGNNLHVSGLSLRVEERDLEELFGKYGRIQKCQVMRDPHSKESRGFAFVTMETVEDAEACITNINATELMGRTMNVEKARRGRARTPTPGQYHGPPKRFDYGPPGGGGGYGERRYEPGGYSRGGGGGYGGGYGGGGGYGRDSRDSRGEYRDYDRGDYRDDRRGDYRDERRGGSFRDAYDSRSFARPMRSDAYDDRADRSAGGRDRRY